MGPKSNGTETETVTLKQWREQLGLSGEWMGNRLDVRSATYRGWERGEYDPQPSNKRELKRLVQGLTDALQDFEEGLQYPELPWE